MDPLFLRIFSDAPRVPAEIDLDDPIDPCAAGQIAGPWRRRLPGLVVDGLIGPGGPGRIRLPLRAHGGEHVCAAPLAQLDGAMSDRARAAGHQKGLSMDGSVRKQATVSRHPRGSLRRRPERNPSPKGAVRACSAGRTIYSAAVPMGRSHWPLNTHTRCPRPRRIDLRPPPNRFPRPRHCAVRRAGTSSGPGTPNGSCYRKDSHPMRTTAPAPRPLAGSGVSISPV